MKPPVKFLQKVLKHYNLSISTVPGGKTPVLGPGAINPDTKQYGSISFPSDVQKAADYYLQNSQVYNPNRNRYELYKALLYMVRNNGIMQTAYQIYVTETLNFKDGDKPIKISAPNKDVEYYFYRWLSSIGVNANVLNELAQDLALYADAFFAHDIDYSKGITEVQLLDPFLVKDVMELDLGKVEETKNWIQGSVNYINRYQAIQSLTKTILDDYGSESGMTLANNFKRYLLGYELKYSTGEKDTENIRLVPPWGITHFRLFSCKDEFYPFGRPIFINSLAPFQAFKTTELIVDMLRVASFPKEIIEIAGGDNFTRFDRMERVNEVREFIENVTPVTTVKDNLSINERLYCMKDLFTYRIESADVDMDKLADLENKLNDLIYSTGIPDSVLIPSRGVGLGGEAAQTVSQNNETTKKRINSIRASILEGFSSMFRLHLSMTDLFDKEATEFELSMPADSSLFTDEKLSQITNVLQVFDSIVQTLTNTLNIETADLPVSFLKDILVTYLPLNKTDIESIFKVKSGEDTFDAKKAKAAEDLLPDSSVGVDISKAVQVGDLESPISTFRHQTLDMSKMTIDQLMHMVGISSSSTMGEAFTEFCRVRQGGRLVETIAKESVKEFLTEYYHGNDRVLREVISKVRKDLGLTEGVIGNRYIWNDSYTTRSMGQDVISLLKEQKNVDSSKAQKLES